MVSLHSLIQFVRGLSYLGAFLSGFLGSSSLFIAIFPSYVVVTLLATQLNPVAVGVLAGIGAGLGQYLHYYIGLGGRVLLPKKYKKKVDRWKDRLKRYGLILVFVFAATPLTPDDLIWIPLGLMKYPKLKALIAAVAGKILLNLLYAFAGYYGWKFLASNLNLPL